MNKANERGKRQRQRENESKEESKEGKMVSSTRYNFPPFKQA